MSRPRPREGGTGGLPRGRDVELEIEKAVYRGLGLGRHQGRVVFVPGTFPGDRVRARVEEVRPGYARARLLENLRAAPERRPSPCAYAPRCGGCAYQGLDYAAQPRLKGEIVRESLARAGVVWTAPLPVEASPEEGWRTRATLHVARRRGPGARPELLLGFHEEGSHRVVDLERCPQLSGNMNRAARGLLAALQRSAARTHPVTDVELAESGDGRQLVAALHVPELPRDTGAYATLAEGVPWLSGIGLLVGEAERGRFISLRGEAHVESEVLGVRLRSHLLSFFQGNRFLVEPLARHVREWLPGGGPVLDLYAGVGLFALTLARSAGSVRAAEGSLTAVDDAEFNARRAGVVNVEFRRADVLAALQAWPAQPGERIVLDPPRAGAGREVLAAVAARRPAALVYVSCDPTTLGRDLAQLLGTGWRLEGLQGFDLFPDTFHVETVARLSPPA